MIGLWIIGFYPMLTRCDATPITKKPGIEVAFNKRIGVFSKRRKGFLLSRCEIIDPLVEYLNIDKLVALDRSRGLRLLV
jgi:hypothetical protein